MGANMNAAASGAGRAWGARLMGALFSNRGRALFPSATAPLAFAFLLAGCSTCEPVRVPVPVPCNAPMPQRPAMPTESLEADAPLDDFVAAAAAEIERREGYEHLLRAALVACSGDAEGGQ